MKSPENGKCVGKYKRLYIFSSFLLPMSLKDIKLYKAIIVTLYCWVYTTYKCILYITAITQRWGERMELPWSKVSVFYQNSVCFSHSVVSDSSRPHELQHPRPPCPSPTPRVHSDSRPSSRWYHPAISSSAVPFSSCPQSLPASESFPMSQLFTWGGQSFSFSIIPSKEHQGLISFRMDWLDLLAV